MARKIDTADARARLPARAKPYWVRLFTGCSLGYRKMTSGAAGTWSVRLYDPATGRDTWRSLGAFDDLLPAKRFDAAMKAAEELAKHVINGGSADAMTVRQACDAYVSHLRADGNPAGAADAAARFARWVHRDKIARIDLQRLTPRHLHAWRQMLAGTDVTANPHAAPEDQRKHKRSPATVNRELSTLRAALNLARESGAVATDAAWRTALRAIAGANKRRKLCLDRKQRAALIAHAPPDVARFLRGLALLPLRPGALAALTAGSFDKRLGVLVIGKDKAGADRGIRLPSATAAFFAELAAHKLPPAPLFTRADGKAWTKDAWKGPIKDATHAAGLPAAVSAYTLRHSTITDLVTGGLDVLTVAILSGTSVRMIEEHYGHLRADHAAQALATLAL